MAYLIPAGATEKHIAFLGATGSGKTSAAKRGLVEPALAAGRRVCVLDPTGAWWGLRLKADGIAKGFSIYIFGGDHGDYPLRARDAGLLAETFATSSDSAIFDMSLMTVSERTSFFTEFAETIRRKNKGPLHLIIDEAHLFMPQAGASSGGAVPAMLHAANNLVSLGRSRGLRIALISQRPAKVHKDSLTQVQSLVAMRLLAPQDRKAIADWIADQADPTKGREIIASLPSLKPGEAWVWSPQDDVLRHTVFPLPTTYDSSRAPDVVDGKGPELAPVNMDALKGRLTAIESEVKANDPKALRAEISRLQSELRTASAIVPPISDDERQRAYQEGISSGRHHILSLVDDMRRETIAVLDKHGAEAVRLATKAFDDAKAMEPVRKPITSTSHVRQIMDKVVRAEGPPIPKGERACLVAAAQHPNGVTRQQLTVLTGYKKSSRDTYLQRLRERGFIQIDPSGRICATSEGEDVLGPGFTALPTGEALRNHVIQTLPAGEAAILQVLISAYPDSVTKSEISARTPYQKSSRDTYLQRLSARELIASFAGHAKASPTLFD